MLKPGSARKAAAAFWASFKMLSAVISFATHLFVQKLQNVSCKQMILKGSAVPLHNKHILKPGVLLGRRRRHVGANAIIEDTAQRIPLHGPCNCAWSTPPRKCLCRSSIYCLHNLRMLALLLLCWDVLIIWRRFLPLGRGLALRLWGMHGRVLKHRRLPSNTLALGLGIGLGLLTDWCRNSSTGSSSRLLGALLLLLFHLVTLRAPHEALLAASLRAATPLPTMIALAFAFALFHFLLASKLLAAAGLRSAIPRLFSFHGCLVEPVKCSKHMKAHKVHHQTCGPT